jgi:DNA-directed RNA polymerase subunit F
MDPKVMEMNPVSLSEVKNELRRIKKRDDELSFRGNKTEDHINSVHVISEKEFKEIYKEIESLNIMRIKPKHIIKFIDLMPASKAEVKFIASSLSITLTKDQISKIFDIMKDHIPKKK